MYKNKNNTNTTVNIDKKIHTVLRVFKINPLQLLGKYILSYLLTIIFNTKAMPAPRNKGDIIPQMNFIRLIKLLKFKTIKRITAICIINLVVVL
jgi:hypothetical protein